MKCRVCNSDVLDIFLYCHCCGSRLRDPDLTREWNPSRANIANDQSSSLSVTASSIPVPPPQLPRFEDFRKRVSASRFSEPQKKKVNSIKEVIINIGIMKSRDDGTLFTVRGKTMPVRVPTTIRKVPLLMASVEKHRDHDLSFNRSGSHNLYPDGREVFTIPSKPTELFQLDKYKDEIGKPYNRITLYLMEKDELDTASEEEFSDQIPETSKASHIQGPCGAS